MMAFKPSIFGPQNTQNSAEAPASDNFEYSESQSRQFRMLYSDLSEAGINLFLKDGKLAYESPAGAMTDQLLRRLRSFRNRFVAVLQSKKPPEVEPSPAGVICCFCNGRTFEEHSKGWVCRTCNRCAWIWTSGGSLVRADFEHVSLAWD